MPRSFRRSVKAFPLAFGALVISGFALVVSVHAQQTAMPITISTDIPRELNLPYDPAIKPTGGAPTATLAQAAAFAWQEFIALNWPAGPQQGQLNQGEAPSTTVKFGDPAYTGPLVWETMRHKVEIFPGTGDPPGYDGSTTAQSIGYDHLPQYDYIATVKACDPAHASDPTPWVNLDETDQIRFLAKADRNEYVYVTGNSNPNGPFPPPIWWQAVPADVKASTLAYLAAKKASPPPTLGKDLVSLPFGTVEIKAGWRQLNPSERNLGCFHTQTVRYYDHDITGKNVCYRDGVWGLVALHIIQKTPSAPSFIYATFEQADNILTAAGKPVEDEDGRITASPIPATTTGPQVRLDDPKPAAGMGMNTNDLGNVLLTSDPATCIKAAVSYCGAPTSQLYYRNEAGKAPSDGQICVDRRDNAIAQDVIDANAAAHTAIVNYLKTNNIPSSPWQAYKLVNVQYHPYNKMITTASPPYSATKPAPSSGA